MFKYFIFWTAHTKQAVCVYKTLKFKSWCLLYVIFMVSMSTQRFSILFVLLYILSSSLTVLLTNKLICLLYLQLKNTLSISLGRTVRYFFKPPMTIKKERTTPNITEILCLIDTNFTKEIENNIRNQWDFEVVF